MKNPTGDVIYFEYVPSPANDITKPHPKAIPFQVGVQPTPVAKTRTTRQRRYIDIFSSHVLFLTINAVLGIVGFCVVVMLFTLGISLLPLCGLGILVWQMLAVTVECMAKVDITVVNRFASMDTEELQVDSRLQCGLSIDDPQASILKRILYVSRQSLLMTLYFVSVKFVVGLLCCLAVGWGIGLPLTMLCTGGHAEVAFSNLTYKDEPVAYVLGFLLCWVVGLIGIPLVTRFSMTLTKWCCAEKPTSALVVESASQIV